MTHADHLQGTLLENEPLSHYTTWRVGGGANQLYKPHDIADLARFLKQLPAQEPILFLGLGSNSLIRDTGFPGTVIVTQGHLNTMALCNPHTVRVEAGVSCATMARFCARQNLADAEFWAGIPGTMGGALRMNAGCYNGETWQHVIEVETITRNGERCVRSPDSFRVSYRHVEGLATDEWFTAATFQLPSGEKSNCLQTIKTLLERRASTQPTSEYNCGSVFRNPPGLFAAQLIEECGLKGATIGHAKVSSKHANFIINEQGLASAQDIESLIQLVQDTVHQKKTIQLTREIHIIGDPK
ncbi:MAG: UDP-N-acetylmuramate dehydrogenase [Gammaproteobacteria bacterium]|nr:UDP-N-acetylmuramate dehydrogenase [Gammaproteobacteria bacterium]